MMESEPRRSTLRKPCDRCSSLRQEEAPTPRARVARPQGSASGPGLGRWLTSRPHLLWRRSPNALVTLNSIRILIQNASTFNEGINAIELALVRAAGQGAQVSAAQLAEPMARAEAGLAEVVKLGGTPEIVLEKGESAEVLLFDLK